MKDNSEALERFVRHLALGRSALERLLQHVDDHMGQSPEGVHWGHVGSASHMRDRLEALVQELGIK